MGKQIFLPKLYQHLLRPDPPHTHTSLGVQLYLLNFLGGEGEQRTIVLLPAEGELFRRAVSPQHSPPTHTHMHTCNTDPPGLTPPTAESLQKRQDLREGPTHPREGPGSSPNSSASGPGSGLAQGRKKTGCSAGRQGRPSSSGSCPGHRKRFWVRLSAAQNKHLFSWHSP